MNLRQRKPNRLQGHDYSQNGYYFVTICTKNREHLFGEVVDKRMNLNEYGRITENEMSNIATHYDNVQLDKYIIMPNHIHMIIIISAPAPVASRAGRAVGAPLAAPVPAASIPAASYIAATGRASAPPTIAASIPAAHPTIGNIVRGFKSGVSRIIGFSVWQRNYHDHIIRNEYSYLKIFEYIENNPMKWENDCHNPNNSEFKRWDDSRNE